MPVSSSSVQQRAVWRPLPSLSKDCIPWVVSRLRPVPFRSFPSDRKIDPCNHHTRHPNCRERERTSEWGSTPCLMHMLLTWETCWWGPCQTLSERGSIFLTSILLRKSTTRNKHPSSPTCLTGILERRASNELRHTFVVLYDVSQFLSL